MLRKITLNNVGPVPQLTMALGERLNLITGDNGLGKSFLLDVCWWALTRKWPAEVNKGLTSGMLARPYGDNEAKISLLLDSKSTAVDYVATFDRKGEVWKGKQGRPWNPGLVLYAQVDGSFSVWDPARNYWKAKEKSWGSERLPAYVFSPREVWDGLPGEGGKFLCEGLIRDWAGWQKERGKAFKNLCSALKVVSPSESEQIEPGELTRISVSDARDIPTLKMPYGQTTPILHASAGMRRIVSLVYLLVWCWEEHKKASKLLGEETTKQVIFLVDEIEAHLHPKWQRRIVTSLLAVVRSLSGTRDSKVQLIVTTHSPLVMASVEPEFDVSKDKWFDLDFIRREPDIGRVEMTERSFVRRGDVSSWLRSEAFDLREARSLEAEQAISAAMEAMQDDKTDHIRVQTIDQDLRNTLGEIDPFWVRWRYIAEKRGWLK